MKRFVTMCAAIGAGFMVTSFVLAAEPQFDSPEASQSSGQPVYMRGTMAAYFADADKKTEGDAKKDAKPAKEEKAAAAPSCGCESKSCGSEAPSCGSDTPSCGSEAGCGSTCCCDDCTLCIDNMWPFCCCCKPGDPCTLEKHLTPCCKDVTYGGFMEIGYHSQNTGLSANDGDQLDTNDYPGRLQLQQGYFYVEKKAKTDTCCCDWGYRMDAVYGTNGQTAQAFGNQNNGWDKAWDAGVYGWAMPQAYVELGYNDWDIKMGHFYTPNAYEVYPANGNFFYSHSLLWVNSEPVTHTGFIAQKKVNDCWTVFGGYVLGWDTAFDAFDGGSAFCGGFIHKIDDNNTFTYGMTAGNFGFRSNGEDGYNQSIILDTKLSKKWENVVESDYNVYGGFNGASNEQSTDYGVADYLFYTINDCWKMGSRIEWWQSNEIVDDQTTAFYELTYGFNYKPNANWIVRPEVRYDWTPADEAVQNAQGTNFYNKVVFGVDAIMTF